MAKIIIPTPLRKFTNNEKTVAVIGKTVKDAIFSLGEMHPQLRPHILDQNGRIRSYIRLYLEDRDILQIEGENTRLEDENTISIIPAIAGG